MLVETTIAMVALAVLSLVMFKATINVLQPRQWSIIQNFSDTYLTYEVAVAERMPFDELTGADSLWPVFPDAAEEEVVIGTLPGGHQFTGTVFRTRTPSPNNLPVHQGTGTLESNPSQMETWIVQCHLKYILGGKPYVKSRTVVRTR
jgi:hypothetical protein